VKVQQWSMLCCAMFDDNFKLNPTSAKHYPTSCWNEANNGSSNNVLWYWTNMLASCERGFNLSIALLGWCSLNQICYRIDSPNSWQFKSQRQNFAWCYSGFAFQTWLYLPARPESHPSPCALNAERNCAFSVKCAFAICAAERGQLLKVYKCNITNIHCSFI
jgi:hypothetical protein